MSAGRDTSSGGPVRRGRRGRLRSFSGLVLLALLAAGLFAGVAAAATPVRIALAPDVLPLNPAYHPGGDWKHAAAVVAYLHRKPPKTPVVYLFGGSAAREATVSDTAWRAQLRSMGSGPVVAYNLGHSSDSYRKDITYVRQLPAGKAIVLIGANLGRYTHRTRSAPPAAAQLSGDAAISIPPYVQHRFTSGDVLSLSAKRGLLSQWVATKMSAFSRAYAGNAQDLAELVGLCLERGFQPVIVNLPIDLSIVRPALDAPRHRFQNGCAALAAKKHIPWVSFVEAAGLHSSDFVDLWHLVHSGEVKYQRLLSKATVKLMKQYHMNGG